MASPTSSYIINLVIILLSLSLTPLSFSEKCDPNDKKALLQIKKDLNNPDYIISWEPKTDCCTEWYGVKCSRKANRVILLDIFVTDVKLLPIPPSVGDLPYLQDLTFYGANVTGQIPGAISKLSDLKSLNLQNNLLTGPVPSFLGNLKKLTFVRLSFNSLAGSITGSIPDSFADFKNHNLILDLSHNQLSGPIPTKLGSANFSSFDVSTNRLEGDLSIMFGKNKSVVVAYFSMNKFEFDLTKIEFSKQLAILDLNNNKIYGSLPLDLSSTGILSLNVSYNRLCGPIPQLGKFQTFDSSVFLHNKCLCGFPLPKCK